MRASTTRAPSDTQNRLNQARLALRLAEERTGLRDCAALTVQRALPAAPSAWQGSGVLTLQGSTTVLLAALALRQGATGWGRGGAGGGGGGGGGSSRFQHRCRCR